MQALVRRGGVLAVAMAVLVSAWLLQGPRTGVPPVAVEPDASAIAPPTPTSPPPAVLDAPLVAAAVLARHFAPLDPIERALALNEWRAVLAVPLRWATETETAWLALEGDAGGTPRRMPAAGPWVQGEGPVVVAVRREGDPAAAVDWLVVGPAPVPARPAVTDPGTPSTGPVGSALSPSVAPPAGAALLAAAAAAVLIGAALLWRRRPARGVPVPGDALPARPMPSPAADGEEAGDRLASMTCAELPPLLRREVDRLRRQHAHAVGAGDGAIGAAGLQVDFDPWLDAPLWHQPALVRRAVRGLLGQAADRAAAVVVLAVRVEAGEVVLEVDDDGAAPPVPADGWSLPDEPECVFADAVAEWHGGRFDVTASALGGLRRTMRWPATTGPSAPPVPRAAALPPGVPWDRRDPRGGGRRAADR